MRKWCYFVLAPYQAQIGLISNLFLSIYHSFDHRITTLIRLRRRDRPIVCERLSRVRLRPGWIRDTHSGQPSNFFLLLQSYIKESHRKGFRPDSDFFHSSSPYSRVVGTQVGGADTWMCVLDPGPNVVDARPPNCASASALIGRLTSRITYTRVQLLSCS
jgi:hypothetical protein